jgi:hypothetical protein
LSSACHKDPVDLDSGSSPVGDDDDDDDAGIPDPYAGLDRTACEGGPYIENTFTTWFVGDLTVTGETATGTETAAVHWSPEWVADCGYPETCNIVWDVSGVKGEVGACVGCDYALSIQADLNEAATNCPEARIVDAGDPQWSTVYDVKLNPDGTTEVSFSASGEPLGGWYWSGDRVTYVTGEPYCFPYPDDISGLCD